MTETATQGTYTAIFTGTTPGTASTLTVTINGVALTTKRTITVTPTFVATANSTVNLAATNVAPATTVTAPTQGKGNHLPLQPSGGASEVIGGDGMSVGLVLDVAGTDQGSVLAINDDPVQYF